VDCAISLIEQRPLVSLSEFEFSPYAQKRQKIEALLRRAGGKMKNSDLLRNSGMVAADYNAVLQTAKDAGILVVEEVNRAGTNQTSKIVRLL
jgi:hypothetical protein